IYSVVIGRFVGPVRPVVPFVAGMLSMKPALFVSINLISALAWAPVYILPGYLLGETAEGVFDGNMSQHSNTLGLAIAAISAIGLGLIYLVSKLLRAKSADKTEK
ncbi:MAG: hypothetical protein OQK12_16095, partial [Motiliproteus sp.]|nr:hypothetical protein [Motiliproteus sp.]